MIARTKFINFFYLASLFALLSVHWYMARMVPNPHYAKVFYRLGSECERKCPLSKQLYYFKKAVFYDPNLSEAYHRLGIVYEEQGDYPAARAAYARVTELDPRAWESHFKTGYYYLQEGNVDLALRYLEQAYKNAAGAPEVNHYLGLVHELKKEYQTAINHYGEVICPSYYALCPQVMSRKGALFHLIMADVHALSIIEDLRSMGKNDLADQLQLFIETDRYPEFMRERN